MIIKPKKNIIIIILALFFVLLGLLWLAIIIILFAVIFFVIMQFISLIQYPFLRKAVKGIFLFVFLLATTISVKLFVVDIYKIPSSSMENLLHSGDVIVVNKLKYGPRLPRSPFEIPWVNLAFYMNDNARARIKKNWWDYSRWGGTTKVKKGDVFVFNSTWDKNFILVKRCVGLPGDTLKVKQGEIYTNSLLFKSPETVKNNCRFRVKDKKVLNKIIDSFEIESQVEYDSKFPNWANAKLSVQELELLQKIECIDSVKKNIDVYTISNQKLLKTTTSQWTLDDMGSIIIPKKGMVISLNPNTFMLYRKVINQNEKSHVKEKNGRYLIKGKVVTHYRFKQNYYFMMGDNRKETSDSRCWGFLPETNIIGKVQCVLYSNKNNKFQWDRLFKAL